MKVNRDDIEFKTKHTKNKENRVRQKTSFTMEGVDHTTNNP